MRDALYSLPAANLPDTPETRRDMASFKASARSLDQGVGAVLNALDEHELADDTLVIFTTDHGLPFPGAKATLTDRGLGVMLIVRGPGGFHGGRVSRRAGLPDRPLPDALRAGRHRRCPTAARASLLLAAGRPTINDASLRRDHLPRRLRARSAPSARAGTSTSAASATGTPVLPNIDDSPSKDLLLGHGFAECLARSSTTWCSTPREGGGGGGRGTTNLAADPARSRGPGGPS